MYWLQKWMERSGTPPGLLIRMPLFNFSPGMTPAEKLHSGIVPRISWLKHWRACFPEWNLALAPLLKVDFIIMWILVIAHWRLKNCRRSKRRCSNSQGRKMNTGAGVSAKKKLWSISHRKVMNTKSSYSRTSMTVTLLFMSREIL